MTTRFFRQAISTSLILGIAFSTAAQADTDNSAAALSAADTVFVQTAGSAGIAEIQLGKMALDQSSDAQIKALGQKMIDDHGKSNAALKTLAESKKVSFPSDASKDALKEADKLKAEKGRKFDQDWTKAIVQDHQDAIKLFEKEGKQSKDQEMQTFVKNTLPALKSHLAAAQKIAAVPDARDKAMGQSAQSMSSAMDNLPAASTSTAATTTATTTASGAATTTTTSSTTPAAATPASTTESATKTPAAAAAPTPPAATTGVKH